MAYSDLKIYQLVRESRDGVVETKPVLPNLCGSEDEIALSLLLFFHDHSFCARFFSRAIDGIVNCNAN